MIKREVKKYAKNNPQVNQVVVINYNKMRLQIKLLPCTVQNLSGYKYDLQTDYAMGKTVGIETQSVCILCRTKK